AVAGGQLKQPKNPLGQSRRADETQSDAHSRKRERAPPPRPLIEHSLQRLGRSLSQSSSRCSWSRPIRWWRGCRTPMAPRRLPDALLLAQRVFSPSPQHCPLNHHEEIGATADSASLKRTNDTGGSRQEIEANLRTECGRIERLAARGHAGHETREQQEWHHEPQEFMAGQLKGESAIAKRIQQVHVPHQSCDSAE